MTRYCSNCRAELPPKTESCPECGVYAGDVFDGRMPREKKPVSLLLLLFLALAIGAALYALWMNRIRKEPETVRPEAPAVRVVGDRPGGARRGATADVTEAEAIRILVAHLVEERQLERTCVVVKSNGYRDGAYQLTAFNHCEQTRMGAFRVTGAGEVK